MGASSPAKAVYLMVKAQKSKNLWAVKDSGSAAASPGCPLNPNRQAKAVVVESWA
jgi:hypothetical protein